MKGASLCNIIAQDGSERGASLIDLEQATMTLIQGMGDEPSKSLFCHVRAGHPNYPDGAEDNTRLHERGAIRIAAMFPAMLRGTGGC